MCSVDNEDDCLMLTTPKVNLLNAVCYRCKSEHASIVLRKKDAYCKGCFHQYATHKFRSSLGKTKVMRCSDKVLVAFSGSQSSLALVHMLHAGINDDVHKKIVYGLEFCYVDEGTILNETPEVRRSIIKHLKQYLEKFNFSLHVTTLNKIFSPNIDCVLLQEPYDLKSEDDSHLLSLFNDIESCTSKEDLLLKFRQKLLIDVAKKLNCNKIFTAELESSLAIKLLTAVALGRGDQLSSEIGFTDGRVSEVLILRPLRDLDPKAIAFYNRFNNLEAVFVKSLCSTSVRKLTEDLIISLKKDYPSTASSVVRTGDKLCNSSDEFNEESICLLCRGGSVNIPDVSYSSVRATAFSRQISSIKCDSAVSTTRQLAPEELLQYFCYGCMLIIRDLKSLDKLPSLVVQQVSNRRQLLLVKNQLSDYLL